MANYSYYIESMQALSSALGKALLLSQVRMRISKEYARVPSYPGDDSKAYLDAIFDVLPRVELLRAEEKTLLRDYVNLINSSLRNVFAFLMTIEEQDFTDPIIERFYKHLTLLYDVIASNNVIGEERINIEKEQFDLVCQRLEAFVGNKQAISLLEMVQKIKSFINDSYVGEK